MPNKWKKPNNQHRLTPELSQEICAYIRAGAFPSVACEAAGIPKSVFDYWMKKGGGKYSRIYRDFADEVRKATAQARVQAEMRAFKNDAAAWLKQGPGKETRSAPGWSSPVKPTFNTTNQQFNVLLDPSMQGLFAALLQILQPYPEARAAVSLALAGDSFKPAQPPPLVVPEEEEPAPGE